MKRPLLVSTVITALFLPTGFAFAADVLPAQIRTQAEQQERVYGSQLMTQQERSEYRARMRTATTAEERERIRIQHHEAMKERARTQGVTLPDEPPAGGGGMGPGGSMGPGGGMSPGGGMGPGGGGMGPGGGRGR